MNTLENGLAIAVKMVRLHGPSYIPIVDRLRQELERKKATDKLISEYERAL